LIQGTAEQNRYWGPLLSDHQWHYALEKANFSGAAICLPDYRDHRHTFSTIISTAKDTRSVSRNFPNTVIITEETSSVQSRIALQTRSQLQELGVLNCEIVSPQEIQSQDLTRVFCIYLLELDQNFLYEIQEYGFQNFKAATRSASGILWLTRGGGEFASRPQVGLVTGLGRSLRSENSHLKFVELALEESSSIADVVQHITKVYQKTLITPSEEIESEYMEKDGKLHINRVVEANDLNDKIHSKVAPQKAELQRLQKTPEVALKLTISSPGLLDTLQFVDDRSVERELLVEQVEIEVKAIGVNFKDIMIAMGQLPANSLGLECSGIITRVGDEVIKSQLKPGDRVCCVAEGAYKTLARTHAAAVSKIPNDMSFSLAAAIPVVFCTAYYAIIHLANLKKDESILIHSGAGGVGQAAIQLAKMLKANIYVTVGNEEKKKLLMDLYHIPEDHFFSSRNERFAEKLKKITGGVDVVLNSLSGERLRQSWNCIAPFGRFIELGKSDIQNNESLPMSPFSQNVLFASVDLSLILKKSKSLMKQLMTSVMNLVIEKQIHTPQPLRVCKASEVEEAFRFLQNGKHSGKTVVELHENDIVPVC
jgi:NADPH:quinone reductase-like Zn-dependent oxidoreductase